MEKLYSAIWRGVSITVVSGKDETEAVGNLVFERFRENRGDIRAMKVLHLTTIHN